MLQSLKNWRLTGVGRFITRTSRKRVPLVILIAITCFSMVALCWKESPSYYKVFSDSASLLAYDFRIGWFWQSLQAGNLTLGVAFAGTALLFCGDYARNALVYIGQPNIKTRRAMKRDFRLLLALTGLSVVSMLCMRPLNAIVDADLRARGMALHAVFEFNRLHWSTLARLADEENSGHWWVDPEDGPATRDIKQSFARTNTWGKHTLHDMLNARVAHKWENKFATE